MVRQQGVMRTLDDGLHVVEGPQRFLGLELGARMTVLETDAGVLVHSPLAVSPEVVAGLGGARWVMAPNKLHHLHVGPWLHAGAEGWAAPGLAEKRPDLSFAGCLEGAAQPFGSAIQVFPLRCIPFTNEVVVFHRPSRSLVVTDLVFNFGSDTPALTRAAMWCACCYPGCKASALERVGMHRATARRELGALLALDFDRLIMAHGQVVETGGKEALRTAYGWLGEVG